MPLRVNNNIAAINSKRQLNANNRVLGQKLERLASGLRINRAADDAAGLSVREGMRAEISGLKGNVNNAEQASNLLQVAEGSLNEVNAILVRMRELAVQSSSSTVTDQNRESIQAEFSQLTQEIDRIAQATIYNNQTLLTGFGNTVNDGSSTAVSTSNATGVTDVRISGAESGTYTFIDDGASDGEVTLGNGTATQTIRLSTQLDGSDVATGSKVVANFDRLGFQVTLAGAGVDGATGNYSDGDLDGMTIQVDSGTGGSFQVGPTDSAFNRIEVNLGDMTATGSKLNLGSAGVASISDARSAITSIDLAITEVAAERGNLGAFQNRLSFTIAYTENEIENIQASEASISDADVAAEVTEFTRAQILSQASTAMMAQANVIPQNALALLQ
ncbi:MAG TPA: flagellin [Acidimicrobiaceae bacterium]|nr:flagellin [Acidimicrobiaceae bacterium]